MRSSLFSPIKICYHLLMKPIKGLGQNFLKDNRALKKIIDSANLSEKDIVLEIGPGKGVLTKELLPRVRKVIAIEKDYRMIEYLQEKFKDSQNLELISGDVLHPVEHIPYPYKVVANIPFYITAPILRMFLESKNPPEQMTLIIQKEVAQRICDKKKMSILALSVLFYADAKIISYISKRSFSPAPKVDSAIIQIIPKKKYKTNPEDFFKVIRAGFAHPRKQLVNNFSTELKIPREKIIEIFTKNNIPEKIRAEDLDIDKWILLVSFF